MSKVTIACPKCGEIQEVNPFSLAAANKTEKQKEAARVNGKKGGRPKKTAERIKQS